MFKGGVVSMSIRQGIFVGGGLGEGLCWGVVMFVHGGAFLLCWMWGVCGLCLARSGAWYRCCCEACFLACACSFSSDCGVMWGESLSSVSSFVCSILSQLT